MNISPPLNTQKHTEIKSTINETEDEDVVNRDRWVYRDPEGNEQGPFSTEDMQRWWFSGFFSPTTEVHSLLWLFIFTLPTSAFVF